MKIYVDVHVYTFTDICMYTPNRTVDHSQILAAAPFNKSLPTWPLNAACGGLHIHDQTEKLRGLQSTRRDEPKQFEVQGDQLMLGGL